MTSTASPRGYAGVLAGTPFACLLLAAIVSTPSAIAYLFNASSHATGLALIAGVALIVLLPVVRVTLRYEVMAAILAFLAIHFLVARELGPTSAARFAGSWALLGVLLVSMQIVARWLVELPAPTLERTLTVLRLFLLLVAVFGIAGVQPPGGPGTAWEKPTFPFTEPSHFAPVFTPMLLAACAEPDGRRRLFWLVVGLAVAAALRNLTLLVGIALIGAVTAPLWQMLVLAAVGVAGFALVDVSYFADRLNFGPHTTNMSSLVYLQGWDFIVDATRQTWAWGVGFQQLGFSPLHSAASTMIFLLSGKNGYLNLQDGGYVAAKSVSELGVFAMAALAVLTLYAVHAATVLRRSAAGRTALTPHRRFCLALVVGYLVDIYVRGVGYFSATTFLLGVALFALALMRVPRASPGPLAQGIPTPA